MAPPPQPPSPSTPGAQYAQQFLSTVLSQRGPAALPYAEDAKWLIRQHLVSLSEAFPSLHPRSSSFTHNDGRTVLLLQADGTIPISYQGSLYHLPASLWLLEPYPRCPPAVFLSPTPNMLVKPHHPHVDRSGAVSVPYLRSWVFPSSNLVDLVRSLSHLFGQDPPLYTRQSPSPAPTPTPPPPSRIYSPYPSRLTHPPADDPADVYRRNAINKLLETVHADLATLRKTREAEIDSHFASQAELRRREQELADGVREMQEEKERLEHQLQLVLMNADVLGEWARENEGRAARIGEVNVDDVFEPVDTLSRQLVECTAADLAVEDAIYALDKAAQEGAVPFEMYLKGVRALSRDQFFHRALGNKVRAAQLQGQVTSMAARAPQYAS